MATFTVVLKYPEYIGKGTYTTHVEAYDVNVAIRQAQLEAAQVGGDDCVDDVEHFTPVAVMAGRHDNLVGLWSPFS